MDIRFNDFYSLDSKGQKILRSVLKLAGSNSISSLTEQSFRRADTETLSTIILSLVDVVDHSLNVLRASATAMDDSKNEQILNQQTVIKLQEELISKQASSGTVDSNVNREQLENRLPSVVRSVVNESERNKQVVMFGVPEDCDLSSTVEDVLKSTCGPSGPTPDKLYRIGTSRPGRSRPVKVHFNSREEARETICNAKYLRRSEKYSSVFIAPDRSPEERAQRRKLVQLLREKREREPGSHHFISQGKICSRDHPQETAQTNEDILTSAAIDKISTSFAERCKAFEAQMSKSFERVDASFDRLTKLSNT